VRLNARQVIERSLRRWRCLILIHTAEKKETKKGRPFRGDQGVSIQRTHCSGGSILRRTRKERESGAVFRPLSVLLDGFELPGRDGHDVHHAAAELVNLPAVFQSFDDIGHGVLAVLFARFDVDNGGPVPACGPRPLFRILRGDFRNACAQRRAVLEFDGRTFHFFVPFVWGSFPDN
jgi:hypothetical protein